MTDATDFTTSPYGRGTCPNPGCGKNISLLKNGTLRSHNIPQHPGSPPYGERCDGSGKTPKED